MTDLGIFTLVATATFFASLAGSWLQRRLPPHHITPDTREVLRGTLGLVATLAALLIGLLIASAKESYDVQRREVQEVAVGFVQLERIADHYGPSAAPLKAFITAMQRETRSALWSSDGRVAKAAASGADAAAGDLIDLISELPSDTKARQTMQGRMIEIYSGISRDRLLLDQQSIGTVPRPLLMLLVATMSALFLGYALLAPSNGTVVAATAVAALVIASSFLLLVALGRPFSGIMEVLPFPLAASRQAPLQVTDLPGRQA